MAYTTSDLSTAQAKLTAQFASSELRAPSNATFMAYLKNGEILLEGYANLRTREDRAITAYFKNRSSRAAGAARAHNHTGTHGTSSSLSPTWATSTDKFGLSLKQGDKNIFTKEEMLVNEMKNVFMNIEVDLEAKAVAHLFANRSGVNAGDGVEGTFSDANDTFEVDGSANADRYMQIINSNMELNNYRQGMIYFCDTIAYNRFQFQAAQGISNATNLSFQFGGNTYVHSVGLTAKGATLGYTKGFVEVVADGNIAALPWIPLQNRQGVETKVGNYASVINPFDGLDYAAHTYEVAADKTATGGYVQDVQTEFEFSVDVSFDVAPLSTANETPILAYALI